MLTSLDRQGDTAGLAAVGFAAYLTKPVRVRQLLDAVARVMSGEPRQWQMDTQPMITGKMLAPAAAQERFLGQVLLVEDNFVNQKVAVRFLERLGCSVEVANNGAEGVAAFQQRRFDIVLMDLQMPVMDGMTATRKIRELETAGHVPIIALTANAMSGDRERCEAAGMDGYLTKPIEVDRLRSILMKFGLANPEAASAPLPDRQAAPAAETLGPPVDLAQFHAITDGDAVFAQELIAAFISSGEQQLAEMSAAIANCNRACAGEECSSIEGGQCKHSCCRRAIPRAAAGTRQHHRAPASAGTVQHPVALRIRTHQAISQKPSRDSAGIQGSVISAIGDAAPALTLRNSR